MSGFSGNAVSIPPTSYTPTDQSGASLAFTGVNISYTQVGNLVSVYGTMTFPTTVSASSAIISLPVPIPNVTYALTPAIVSTSSAITGGPVALVPVQNTSTAAFKLTNVLSAVTNVTMTGVTVRFFLTYPAS